MVAIGGPLLVPPRPGTLVPSTRCSRR
jgi:hypothetical protein